MKVVVLVLVVYVSGLLATGWRALNPSGAVLPGVENPTVTLLPHTDDAYFFGGQITDFATQTNTAFNEVFHYDISSNQVTHLNPTGARPAPRIFHGAWEVTDHSFMIAGGGNYPFFFSPLTAFNDFWKYNTATNLWTQIFPTGDTFPQLLSFVVQKTDLVHVYLFGGVNANFAATGGLYVYNILQNTVTQLHPTGAVPADRYHTYSFPTVKGFAIFGGVDSSGNYINDMWEYDTSANTWTQIIPNTQTPPNRTHGVTGKYLDRVLLSAGDKVGQGRACGGAIFPQSPANDTWIFNTILKTWRQLRVDTPTPPLKYSAFFTFTSHVFAFGGYTFDNDTCVQTHNSNVWEFDFPTVFDD